MQLLLYKQSGKINLFLQNFWWNLTLFLTHWLSRKFNVNKNWDSLWFGWSSLALGSRGHSGANPGMGSWLGGKGGLKLFVPLGVGISDKTRTCFFNFYFFLWGFLESSLPRLNHFAHWGLATFQEAGQKQVEGPLFVGLLSSLCQTWTWGATLLPLSLLYLTFSSTSSFLSPHRRITIIYSKNLGFSEHKAKPSSDFALWCKPHQSREHSHLIIFS